MKLHRQISEMTSTVPYELTLGEVISAGDVTNPYQTYVLSLLANLFKAPGFYEGELGGDGLPTDSMSATSTASIEAIKSLSPSDKVSLATYLLSQVIAGEDEIHRPFMAPH